MIDIENELFTAIATALRISEPDVFVTGEYVKAPPKLPCVMIVEMSNTTLRSSQTQDDMENHAVVMYEVNVFSNKTKGKKAECKKLMGVVDDVMIGLGFDRMFLNQVPNLLDSTIYRITARYEAIVGKDQTIYRRI